MIHYQQAIANSQDGNKHSFKFISKGTPKNKRKGGYVVEMTNSVVTSVSTLQRKFNIKQLDSGQLRWCYFVLLIEFDGEEVYL